MCCIYVTVQMVQNLIKSKTGQKANYLHNFKMKFDTIW